jgi:hypothetical protein
MTAFFTPYSTSKPEAGTRLRGWRRAIKLLGTLILSLAVALPAPAAQIKSAELFPSDDWYYLYTDIDLPLPKALEDALNKGISLNFMLEFELTKSRWYWFDETVASVRQNLRLSYHALTRQYHFSGHQGNRSFVSLNEAKEEIRHITEWKVMDRALLKKGTTYQAAVRIRLDVNQLPKPLQVEALSSKDWNFNSDWYRFPVSP